MTSLILDQEILSTPLYTFHFSGAIMILHIKMPYSVNYVICVNYVILNYMHGRHQRGVARGCTNGE